MDDLRSRQAGTRLAEVRRRKRWSLRALAKQATLTSRTLRLIEAGGDPGISTVEKIANALEVSPAWLAYGLGSEGA